MRLDCPAEMVLTAPLVPQDQRASQVLLDWWERLAYLAATVTMGLMVRLVQQVRMVLQVPLGQRV